MQLFPFPEAVPWNREVLSLVERVEAIGKLVAYGSMHKDRDRSCHPLGGVGVFPG